MFKDAYEKASQIANSKQEADPATPKQKDNEPKDFTWDDHKDYIDEDGYLVCECGIVMAEPGNFQVTKED